jgi:hypothetical protein
LKRESFKKQETKPTIEEAINRIESENALPAKEDGFLNELDDSWMFEL